MDTVRLYRVEHPQRGEGPYTSEEHDVEGMDDAHGSAQTHPSPWNDGINMWSATVGHHCAFTTLGALREWFRGWGDRLSQKGHVVSVYEAPAKTVLHGRRQVMFVREDSTLLKSWDVAQVIS